MTLIYEVVENKGNEVILISTTPIRVRISHTLETLKCKDCKFNGKCELQDAPPEGKFTKEEIENSQACGGFKPKVK